MFPLEKDKMASLPIFCKMQGSNQLPLPSIPKESSALLDRALDRFRVIRTVIAIMKLALILRLAALRYRPSFAQVHLAPMAGIPIGKGGVRRSLATPRDRRLISVTRIPSLRVVMILIGIRAIIPSGRDSEVILEVESAHLDLIRLHGRMTSLDALRAFRILRKIRKSFVSWKRPWYARGTNCIARSGIRALQGIEPRICAILEAHVPLLSLEKSTAPMLIAWPFTAVSTARIIKGSLLSNVSSKPVENRVPTCG